MIGNELIQVNDTQEAQFFLNGEAKTTQDFIIMADAVIQKISDGDYQYGINVIRSMFGMIRATGLASAKIIHGFHAIWKRDNGISETNDAGIFYVSPDFILEFSSIFGLSSTSMGRYIIAWEANGAVPEDLRETFQNRPMKDWNALGASIIKGNTPTKEQWELLANAENNPAFLEVIREIEGREPRKTVISLKMDRKGDIYFWDESGKTHVGYLNTLEAAPGSKLERAIHNIIEKSNIKVKE